MVVSDENGYYELDKLGLVNYWICCEIGGCYDLGFIIDNGVIFGLNFYLNVKKGKIIIVDYYMVDYGNYQLVVNNVNCQGVGDIIVICCINFVGFFLFVDWIIMGCLGYIMVLQQVFFGDVYIYYMVKRSGVVIEYDEIFIILVGQENI